MPTIEQEIQQTKFRNSLHRAQVNVLYTSNWLNNKTMLALKPYGLSLQQFNILRILRGRGDRPSTIKLLTERMLDKMSNASRLVDKLKEKGLVQRQQCPRTAARSIFSLPPPGWNSSPRPATPLKRTWKPASPTFRTGKRTNSAVY